ncbi:hypothetical protein AUR64_17940 [Haloprofundus marisrubri]|uniref:Uncharacterized protein n=1 Tax=Haloprofundus marisrubri TaxID=1514971 RepID=A0A0W1R573_9EURY|nr:hypothetical protein [Haloprofundus marisrubri]KTG08558.1 hypothetical protein AUR64_17940 [Haloprofundus marisrubri]
MRPETAARQLTYIADTRYDEDSASHWEEYAYADVFEYVYENGERQHMTDLVARLGDELRDGYRPTSEDAQVFADSVMTEGGRPLTDGGKK